MIGEVCIFTLPKNLLKNFHLEIALFKKMSSCRKDFKTAVRSIGPKNLSLTVPNLAKINFIIP
jgi:hypothetical protein